MKLWYGKYWAIQWMPGAYFSLGIHIDYRYVDLHFWWFIVSVGIHPERTRACDGARWTSRGFLVDPVL